MANLLLKAGMAYEAITSIFKAQNTVNVPAPTQLATIADSENFFQVFGGNVFFEMMNGNNIGKFYRECPPLSYILNKKTQLLLNGKISAVDDKGEAVKGKLASLFNQILKYPNPLQTHSQFEAQSAQYSDLYGWCIWLKINSVVSDVPNEIYCLNPQYLEITRKVGVSIFVEDLKDLIETIYFNYNGVRTKIDKEDIYLFTGQTTTIDDMLYPCSKLHGSKYIINNLIKNYETRGVIFETRGAEGILSPENDVTGTVRATPDTKKDFQEDYQKYGALRGQMRIIITSQSLRWTPMSKNVAEMQLLEMAEDDIKTLCDTLSLEYALLSRGNQTAYNNVKEAKIAQYQDTTIPQGNNYVEQLTDVMNAEAYGVKYINDFSHVPSLQANIKEKSEVRKNNVQAIRMQFMSNLITYGRSLEVLEENHMVPDADKFFHQMPIEFQNSYKNTTNEQNNIGNQSNNQG
jgi:hypothetical protein